MLGKLVKNEIKASAHTMSFIYIAALVTIGIMLLAYLIDVMWLSALATLALMLIALISLVVTFIGVIVNFSKTLYGPQGYLNFTLPVSSRALLASKAIVAFLWMLISYIISIGLIVGVYMYISSMVGEDNIEMIKMLIQMFSSLPSDTAIRQYVILMAFTFFIQIAFLVAELFFSITFANTRVLQKLGGLAPIIVFFVIFIIGQVCNFLLTSHVPIIVSPEENGLVLRFSESMLDAGNFSMGISGYLFQLLACVGLFAATDWLMKHKVNIK